MTQEQNITMTDEKGNEITFTVLADTVLQGKTYLLVTEGEEAETGETPCDILVRIGEDADYWSYAFVEDEDELENVFKIFETMLSEEDENLEV